MESMILLLLMIGTSKAQGESPPALCDVVPNLPSQTWCACAIRR